MGLIRGQRWRRAEITVSEMDHTKIYKEMEHARARRPQRGMNQSIKQAKSGKKCKNFAKKNSPFSGREAPKKTRKERPGRLIH